MQSHKRRKRRREREKKWSKVLTTLLAVAAEKEGREILVVQDSCKERHVGWNDVGGRGRGSNKMTRGRQPTSLLGTSLY